MKQNLSMEIQKVIQQQRGEGLYYLRISGRFVDPQEIFLELPHRFYVFIAVMQSRPG